MKTLTWFARNKRLVLVLLCMLTLVGMARWSGLRDHLSLEGLRQILLANQWQGLALFVLLFSIGNLVQVPGWIFLASAVLVLGRWGGGIVTYVAACVSCAVTFLSVRWVGGNAMLQIQSPLVQRMLSRLHVHPVRTVIALRTVFQTLAALNYTLAMSGIAFRQYVAATLLGLPLPIAVYCVFFDYIEHLLRLH